MIPEEHGRVVFEFTSEVFYDTVSSGAGPPGAPGAKCSMTHPTSTIRMTGGIGNVLGRYLDSGFYDENGTS